jgi:hypothetical protein
LQREGSSAIAIVDWWTARAGVEQLAYLARLLDSRGGFGHSSRHHRETRMTRSRYTFAAIATAIVAVVALPRTSGQAPLPMAPGEDE